MRSFNSTTVQLILYPNLLSLVRLQFQFHNGTINTFIDRVVCEFKAGFNSTTVQLILRQARNLIDLATRFQFHNGTINTIIADAIVAICAIVSIPQRYN